eukprot:4856379-Heterocapsa_arctica.AAC.1
MLEAVGGDCLVSGLIPSTSKRGNGREGVLVSLDICVRPYPFGSRVLSWLCPGPLELGRFRRHRGAHARTAPTQRA